MSSTSDKNNSNTNPNGSSSAANNINNNPLTKSDEINEEQCDDDDFECYQENGLDADFYEEDDELPPLSEELRLERIEHYRNQVENRDYCPHSLLEVYKDTTVLAESRELEENKQDFSPK